jgi:hypothetical protein
MTTIHTIIKYPNVRIRCFTYKLLYDFKLSEEYILGVVIGDAFNLVEMFSSCNTKALIFFVLQTATLSFWHEKENKTQCNTRLSIISILALYESIAVARRAININGKLQSLQQK